MHLSISTETTQEEICMSTEVSLLFRDYKMGPLQLKNRIVMAPLARARSSRAAVRPEFAEEDYRQGTGYAFTPGIWSSAQVESWKRVTQVVHEGGGLIVMQLWHTGRISHPELHGGAFPVSASEIKPGGDAFSHQGPKRG